MSGKKNVKKMNNKQIMNFIDYYKKEQVLWNTKLQTYRNKYARREALKRIVSAINIEGFGTDHVISKFKSLRSSYSLELKKIAASEKSGTSVKDIYVPRVIWFSKMDSFLKPYVTIRDLCSNYAKPKENNTSDIENTDRGIQIMNELNESFRVQATPKENNTNDIENTDRGIQIMNELNESFRVQVSNNEVELHLAKHVPSTSDNSNTNSTLGKIKLFTSPRKRDWNGKLKTLRSSSNETDSVLVAVKQLDSIAESVQKLSNQEDNFTNTIMNEIIENDNANVWHEQHGSSIIKMYTSDFGSPAMFQELLSENPFTEAEDSTYTITELLNLEV